ncbi:7303_t:CDS:1, partial [Funneliformis caledonium]
DSFDLLVNNTQTIILSEEKSFNKFNEDNNEEIENFEPLYSVASEMTFIN